jgi:uncharacterized damage-inducible protein DinB
MEAGDEGPTAMNAANTRQLLDYHYWARDRVLEAVGQLDAAAFTAPRQSSFSSIRDTLAHTYLAEWAWYSRWQGQSPTSFPPLDQFADVAALTSAWRGTEQHMRAFVEPMSDADLARVIAYRLMSGADAASPIWQMVQHVVNHASYHRGQVTTMLRQAGAKPAKSMDLIAFYRERLTPGG